MADDISIVIEDEPITILFPDQQITLTLTQTTPVGGLGNDGTDGREVELQTSLTHIQWRYVGDLNWLDLIALTELEGPAGADGAQGPAGDPGPAGADGAAGADGREVELQKSATHVQWRYVGDPTWIDLVPLTDITGPAGADGADADGGSVLFIDAAIYDPGGDIVLGDPNISRQHAELRPDGDGGWTVADLGSTNGTKVNDARVAEQQLREGDEVRFGNTVMHFQAS